MKKIGERKGNQETFLKNIEKFIRHILHEAPKQLEVDKVTQSINSIKTSSQIGVCPACKKAVIDKGKFYGCEGFTNGCRFSLPKTYLSKAISASNIKKLLDTRKSNLIKGFKSQKKGTTFEAILILNADNELKMEFPRKKK
ncbi:topoisomerase C-terminal repeat-containing protein [Pseudobacillus badius]|uniref:topoisomerase C-terminal repeat-containing protein n=1 Tax=Bacillus badius TaxID=1455 RepID=UPI003D348D46